MKTVTGKVTSSSPVSLSKAAKYLSQFVSTKNGASPSLSVYLQRTSDSFKELVQLRHELQWKSNRKRPKSETSEGNMDDRTQSVELSQQPVHTQNGEDYRERKKDKKKRSEFEENGRMINVVDANLGNNLKINDGTKHKKKKKKNDKAVSSNTVENPVGSGIEGKVKEVEERKVGHSTDGHTKKKNKKKEGVPGDRERVEGEREGEMSMAKEKEMRVESKKRKFEVLEGKDLDKSEQPKNKKKRRKSE